MKKLSKRVLSLVLSILILASLCTVMITANAADGTTVYYRNSKNFGTVYAYYWPKGGEGPVKWPGTAMTADGDNIYSINVPAGNDMIIFNNGSGTQTDDLSIPGAGYLYDGATDKWEEYNPGPKMPSISASKKDGASFKSETLEVTVTVTDATSASYSIDGGSNVSFTDSAVVTLGKNVAVGSTTTLSVTATNENGTTTKTFTYTKKEAGSSVSGGDGSTAPALDGYFSTNPNGQVGKQANITIDGSISDWDSSMLIAQGVANDDPRVYRPNSMYEIAMDDYALYAAWDNDNLYLMWEMANVQDAVAPSDTYPISQGNLWINNMPIFLYFSVDPSIEGDGSTTTDATVWNSGITLDANIDTVIACSTNGSNGPFVYKANDDGKIVYNDNRQSSIKMMWGNEVISTELWGIDEGYGHYNNRIPGDVLDESSAWIDFYTDPEHSKGLDMFYEMSIPLDLLGTSASELTSNGIGLMKVSTFGTSGMNSLPADPSMWDNADLDYSGQEPNSREKEDADHITVPLARIGKALEGGTTPDKPIIPPSSEDDSSSDETPSTPTGSYILGDADGDGNIAIMDATFVQRHCASISTLTGIRFTAADVNKDGNIAIMDATLIQRYLAGSTNNGVGERY
ncbi:MAG: starch-binding protein [Ruminococcus sp.]|nr:starch-binding protein [Ruminococcus sp.]